MLEQLSDPCQHRDVPRLSREAAVRRGVSPTAAHFAHGASRHSLVSPDGSEEQGRRPTARSQRSLVGCKHPAVADDPGEAVAACSAPVFPRFPVAGGHPSQSSTAVRSPRSGEIPGCPASASEQSVWKPDGEPTSFLPSRLPRRLCATGARGSVPAGFGSSSAPPTCTGGLSWGCWVCWGGDTPLSGPP